MIIVPLGIFNAVIINGGKREVLHILSVLLFVCVLTENNSQSCVHVLGVFAGSTEGANGIWPERRECSMLTGKGGGVVRGWHWRWGSAETERRLLGK